MIDIDEKSQKAIEYFKAGYNCSQAVLLAYSEFTQIPSDQLAAIASPFGGGMGRLREVCGAVSGMFLVSGFVFPNSDPSDKELQKKSYEAVQQLADGFKQINGSIICRELLGMQQEGKESPVAEVRTAEYYKKRPCVELVGDAARVLGEYINNNNIKD